MKKVFTIATITALLVLLGVVVMIDGFGQGPKQAIDQTSETRVSETIIEQGEKSPTKNPSQLKTGEEKIKDCPSHEAMLGNPVLSIECYLYKEYFDEAYQLYPNIPRGVLEAVASQQRGFIHITEDDYGHPWDAHDVPRTYTVMSYYDLPGYEPDYNNLTLVSNLSGFSKEEIKNSPRISILAYAKVFSEKMIEFNASEDDWVTITRVFSFLDHRQDGTTADKNNKELFLRLLSLSERAETLDLPVYELDIEWILNSFEYTAYASPKSLCTDYSNVDYDEMAAACNYGIRSVTSSVNKITIHTIEGTSFSAKEWFQDCQSGVSAHYISGEYPDHSNIESVIQSVCEEDKAYHVGVHNSSTIGIEHAGSANATLFTSAFYQESADLVADIASRYPNINPLAMYTGPAHSVTTLLPTCLDIKGHQHFDISTNSASSKYDPGDTWDWFYYYGLVNNNPIQTNYTASSGAFFDPGGSAGNYGGLQNREYIINTGQSGVVLNILNFNLGPGDYVWIYDEPYPNIQPNPHNNTTENGIGPNAPNDVPVGNFLTGSISGLTQTSFTSTQGGFRIIFRSDCQQESSGFQMSWGGQSTTCSDTYEPNNTAGNAAIMDLVGSGAPWSFDIDACVSGTSDDDWYEILLLEPGLLTVTLSEPAPLQLNLISQPPGTVTTLPNGNKKLTFCHSGLSCYPLRIKVWDPGILGSANSDYDLALNWNPLMSCIPNNLTSISGTPKSGSTGLTLSNISASCSGFMITAQVSGGSGMYDWYIGGNFVGSGPSLSAGAGSSGFHNILVIDRNNPCLTAWDDVTISSGTANPSISPSAPSIANGGSIQLFASGGSSYSWAPSTGLSNSNIWNPIASPASTTTYTVTVTDAGGCTSTATATVNVSGTIAIPGNNTPCSAEVLPVSVNSCSYTTGTNVGATNSGVVVNPLCGSTSTSGNATGNYAGGDVWYKLLVPSSGMVVIQTQQQSSLNDAVIAAYTGSCGSLTMIACADDQSSTNFMPLMTLTNLNPNTWVYIRVWEFGNNVFGDFGICATTAGAGSENTSGPDLIVTSFSLSDHTVDQGDYVTVSFTIKNQGTQTSPACWYMCGLAETFQANLIEGGLMDFAVIPSLAPGLMYTLSLNLIIPNVDDGVYYLILGADEPLDNVDEANEDNNLRGEIVMVGDVTPQGVDLDVTTRYLSQTSGLQPGMSWEIGIEVENDGTEDAIGTSALVVLSTNNTYEPGIDIFLWQFNTSDLGPGESDYDEKWITFPPVPHAGTWRVLFIADANHQILELDESNNIGIRTVTVSTTTPATADYVTTIHYLHDKTTGQNLINNQIPAHHELEIFTSTTNQGLIRPSVASRTRFAVSPLPYLVGMQARIGTNTHSSAGIAVGGIDNASPDEFLTGVQVGTNYIIALTDYRQEIYEGIAGENNNVLVYPFEVTYTGPVADLVPQIISMAPYSNALGDSIMVITRIYNYGDTTAYDFSLRHWISIDDEFDGRKIDGRLEQTLVGIDSLAPGDSIDVVRHMALDNDFDAPDLISNIGQYYVLAVVDEECEDVIESSVLNNVSSIPVYVNDMSCYVNMRWHYDNPIDTVEWDATHLDWIYFESPEDCQYTIQSSPWMTMPFTMTQSGETVEYPIFSENTTSYDRIGCIYAGDEDSLCFIQKAAPAVTLPVTWIAVDAYALEGKGIIFWEVGMEYNVSHYAVESSLDGLNFNEIGVLEPLNQLNSMYYFPDELYAHTMYYRVIAVDHDGTRDQSKIVSLGGRSPDEEIYSLTRQSLGYELESFGEITYHLYSMLGQLMYSSECYPSETCTIQIHQTGMYMLVIMHNHEYYVEKLIF